MNISIGDTYLITTSEWFFAPNGETYKAAFGTVHGVKNDNETLGIKTNKGHSNWFVIIGNLIIAGCQIKYAVKTKSVSFNPPTIENNFNGKLCIDKAPTSRIYNADSDFFEGEK